MLETDMNTEITAVPTQCYLPGSFQWKNVMLLLTYRSIAPNLTEPPFVKLKI